MIVSIFRCTSLRLATVSFLLALPLLAMPVAAQARLPLTLTDGAVVQRGRPVPVWGRATPDAEVRVVFAGAERTARAGADGRWQVFFPALGPGGPYEIEVVSDGDRTTVRDVLVGDVWIASGQSNMEWTVADARHADAEIMASNDRTIRHFKVPQSWAETP